MSVDLVRAPSRPIATIASLTAHSRHRGRRPWLRLLSEVLQLAGADAEFLRHAERPWSSATFTGSRHTVLLSFTGPDALPHGEALVAALPDHEFTIPGHLVADATIVAVDHENGGAMTVEAEFLLLEDL